MWIISGISRITYRLVEIAVATCEAERKRILRQEEENYFDLRATKLRVAA